MLFVLLHIVHFLKLQFIAEWLHIALPFFLFVFSWDLPFKRQVYCSIYDHAVKINTHSYSQHQQQSLINFITLIYIAFNISLEVPCITSNIERFNAKIFHIHTVCSLRLIDGQTFLYRCNLEGNQATNPCFNQLRNDQFDWTLRSGPTPSGGANSGATGPTQDHTCLTDSQKNDGTCVNQII